MKTTKRVLAFFLALLMLLTSFPIVYATEGEENSAGSETSISAENGMGQIIENLTETEAEESTDGYSISDMTIENNIANVTVNAAAACRLVVAVYDENTLEMLCSETKEIEASVFTEEQTEDIISVELGITELPEHFLAKAYLLDENNNALCKNHVCRTYTTAFEVFMETTPDDFAGKEIVTFDDSCDDFGVLVDSVVATEKSDTMTYSYNEGTYTFYNATDEVKSLKTDDIYYYQLSDEIGDFLLIKIKTIKVDGSTVTITEDEEIALGDAFQFIRIDEDADFSDVTLTEDNLGSALSLQDSAMQMSVMTADAEVDLNKQKTFSTTLNVSYPNNEAEDKNAWKKGWSVKGSFAYSISANVKLYYDIRSGKDFYEFSTELTHKVGLDVTFSGQIESNPKYFSINFPTIPIGVFNLDISVYPVLSAEASMTFGGSLEIYNKISFTDGNGLTKINDTKWLGGDFDFGKTEIELKLGIGVDCDIGFKKGDKDTEGLSKLHASLTASFEGGITANLTPSLVGVLLDKHHDCGFCLNGSLSAFLNGKATLKLKIISKKLKWTWNAISLTGKRTIGDCYFSISGNGVKFGFDTCPNISHKVTITVYSENGSPVLGAVVSTTTGYCDADGDEKFEETSMSTDENGQAVFYFAKGNHEVIAKKNNLGTSGQQFEMLANSKEIYLQLFDAEYFNGHWYKVYEEKMFWLDAKSYCEKLGGHLVTITSQNENNYILSLISKINTSLPFSIGMTDSQSEGDWKWVTNETVSYTNWGTGQPDNDLDCGDIINDVEIGQNYGYIRNKYDKSSSCDPGEWDDSSSNIEKRCFICEWETIPTSSSVMSYSVASLSLTDETQEITETVVNGTTASRTDALKDTEYVLAVIKDETAEDLLAKDNLVYIDQKTAEGSEITFDFVLPEGSTEYTAKIFGISHTHTPSEATAENEINATCTASGSYDKVIYCSVCGEEMSRENIVTTATGHTYTSTTTSATCTKTGSTTYTCSCGDSYSESIPATEHFYGDDNICDSCGTAKSCSHICHKSGFMGFIWKIVRFFIKLFKIQKYCGCGAVHW